MISSWEDSGGFFLELSSSARACPTSSPRTLSDRREESVAPSPALELRQNLTASATKYSVVVEVRDALVDAGAGRLRVFDIEFRIYSRTTQEFRTT